MAAKIITNVEDLVLNISIRYMFRSVWPAAKSIGFNFISENQIRIFPTDYTISAKSFMKLGKLLI